MVNADGGDSPWAVACPQVSSCVAGGVYMTGSGANATWLPYVVSEVGGVWQSPRVFRAKDSLSGGEVFSISCSSVGNCAAAGLFDVPQNQTFVVTERNGVWGGVHFLGGAPYVSDVIQGPVAAVSCPSDDRCTAVGDFSDQSDKWHYFWEQQERGGGWGPLHQFPAKMLPNETGELASITCLAPAQCVATVASNREFHLIERGGGRWRGSHSPSIFGDFRAGCIRSRLCYQGVQNEQSSMTARIDLVRGSKIVATTRLHGPPLPFKGGKDYYVFGVDRMACSTKGRCVAIVGTQLAVRQNAPHLDLYSVEVGGRWSGLRRLPGVLGRFDNVYVSGLGCSPQGVCVAAGTFGGGSGALSQTFFANV
jgi:hypothetical protein